MIEDTPPNEEIPSRFIELATRPLEAQPEVRDEARGELMGRLSHACPAGGPALDAATARLEETKPRRWGGQAIAMAIALLVLGAIAVLEGFSTFAEAQTSFGLMSGDRAAIKDAAHLRPEQREFAKGFGTPNNRATLDFGKLRESFPDDPVIYEGFVDQEYSARHAPPTGYRETWQRIDPGNGVWPFKIAMAKMDTAVDPGPSTVRDETAFREAWEALDETVAAERFSSHGMELRRRFLELIKEPKGLMGQAGLFAVTQQLDYSYFSYTSAQALTKGFEIQAARLEAAKDEPGLHRLIETWEKIARMTVADAAAQTQMFNMNRLLDARDGLLDVATRMGATADKERLERIDKALDSAGFGGMTHTREMGMTARAAGGIYPVHQHPEVFTPGRKAEYAFFDQLVVLLALLGLLVVGMVVCIESVRRGKRVNGLADGLGPLFRTADHLWIAGLGIALPLAWYLGITRLTPLGCRDIGIIEFDFPPSLIQSLAAYLLFGVMVIQTARWRITRRARFLALGSRRLIVGWITALLPAAVIPLTGSVRDISGATDDFLMAMALTCGIPLLWLLWQGGAMLFSPGSSALDGVLLARKVAWPLVGLITLLVASHPLLRAIEQKWIARDEISRCDPAKGGITQMEWLSNQKTTESFLKALRSADDPP